MKTKLIVTIALSAGLFGGMIATTNNANAASWHKGTPKYLRGTWTSKQSVWPGTKTQILVTKKSVKLLHFQNPDSYASTKYRYIGHHKYTIVGREVLYIPNKATRKGYVTLKWHSKRHISMSGQNFYR